jgi:protease IV
MKKQALGLLLVLMSAVLLTALEYPGTATGDDFLSLRVNPASMAFGNAGGLAFIQPYLLEKDGESRPELLRDFSLQLASSNLGYYFDKTDSEYLHNILLAAEPFPNLYLGYRGSWLNGGLTDARGSLGLLARPSDFLSLGATIDDLFTSERGGRLGAGIRPLIFSGLDPSLLTLGADIPWERGFDRPVLHAAAEPLPGFSFSVAWDMEQEQLSAGFSYSLGIGRAGTLLDGDTTGAAFLHLGTKAYTSPALPLTDPYIRFQPGTVIVEEPDAGFSLFTPRDRTLLEVLDEIERLEKDPTVRGIVIENENFLTGRAAYLELIEALNRFRDSGKKVVYYYENITLWNYILAASTGDAIYLNRMGSLDLRGIGSTRLYFGGLLDEFGIKVHNIRSHPYKSGANTVSEAQMTDEEREMLEYLYEGIWEEILKLIQSGRGGKLKGDIDQIVSAGPYLISDEALSAGLVDGIIYADELTEKLKEFDKNPVITDGYFRSPFRRDWSDPYTNQIALIYAVGNIIPGRGMPGMSIGSTSISDSIREARENPFVKALLIRIDSGGGSSLASDVIAREIRLTVEEGKPVVVSMAGTAASGGYYIAAWADRIIASPVSITGSIGVYAAFPEISGLLEKYKVGSDSVGTQKNADFANPFRRLEAAEREKIEAVIERIYNIFIEVVAEGRGMEKEEVDSVARGRVWSGSQAMERGLVDQLGGLREALAAAVEEAGISGQYMLVDYSTRDLPLSLRMARTLSSSVRSSLPSPLGEAMDRAALLSVARREHYLYLMPYDLEE